MAQLKCPDCGVEVLENEVVCHNCGALLKKPKDEEAITIPQPVIKKETATEFLGKEAKKIGSPKRISFVAPLAVFIFIVVLGGGAFIFGRQFFEDKTIASILPIDTPFFLRIDLKKNVTTGQVLNKLLKVPQYSSIISQVDNVWDSGIETLRSSILKNYEGNVYIALTKQKNVVVVLPENKKANITDLSIASLVPPTFTVRRGNYQKYNIATVLSSKKENATPTPSVVSPVFSFVTIGKFIVIAQKTEHLTTLIDLVRAKRIFSKNSGFHIVKQKFDDLALASLYVNRDIDQFEKKFKFLAPETVVNFYLQDARKIMIKAYGFYPSAELVQAKTQTVDTSFAKNMPSGAGFAYLGKNLAQHYAFFTKQLAKTDVVLYGKLQGFALMLKNNNIDLPVDIYPWLDDSFGMATVDYKVKKPYSVLTIDVSKKPELAQQGLDKIIVALKLWIKNYKGKKPVLDSEIINSVTVYRLVLPLSFTSIDNFGLRFTIYNGMFLLSTSKDSIKTIILNPENNLASNNFFNRAILGLNNVQSLSYAHTQGAKIYLNQLGSQLTASNRYNSLGIFLESMVSVIDGFDDVFIYSGTGTRITDTLESETIIYIK